MIQCPEVAFMECEHNLPTSPGNIIITEQSQSTYRSYGSWYKPISSPRNSQYKPQPWKSKAAISVQRQDNHKLNSRVCPPRFHALYLRQRLHVVKWQWALMKELFSIECRQTKTIVIPMANQKQGKEPLRTHRQANQSAGKCTQSKRG